jgi:hypothetical protein
LDISKASFMNFGRQLFGAMEVGSREIGCLIRPVAVLTSCQVTCYDLAKLTITKESSRQSVNKRGKTRNCGCDQDTFGLEDAAGFAKGQQAIRTFNKVIQGT